MNEEEAKNYLLITPFFSLALSLSFIKFTCFNILFCNLKLNSKNEKINNKNDTEFMPLIYFLKLKAFIFNRYRFRYQYFFFLKSSFFYFIFKITKKNSNFTHLLC